MAERTPESRNRYVDFLRALSIGCVVFGHWLIAAPFVTEQGIRLDHMLAVQPWTQWLTWLCQVMPVFFMVGGYSNAASWDAARRSGQPYGDWIAARLHRLFGPVMPLLAVWAVSAATAGSLGVPAGMIRVGSQVALIPLWFLAVYALVTTMVPLTRLAWRRWGLASFWVLAAAAVVVDAARFGAGLVGLGWSNYLFVWLSVHQLGYLWRDGRVGGASRSLPWALGGGIALAAMVAWGPYQLSMVGVPGAEVSNTLPPSLAMLALGLLQGGLLLALERPARRLLQCAGAWTATVLVNGTIMSIYLWHSSVMIWLIGLANLAGGIGLRLEPGSGAWWVARPPWMLLYLAGLLPVLALFGRFERQSAPLQGTPAWRSLGGTFLVCFGLALIALKGIGSDGLLGLHWPPLLSAFAGAALLGISPWPRRSPPRASRAEKHANRKVN
jgi:hypothetical protein